MLCREWLIGEECRERLAGLDHRQMLSTIIDSRRLVGAGDAGRLRMISTSLESGGHH